MLGDFWGWLNAPPRITKFIMLPSIIIPILCKLRLISVYPLVAHWAKMTDMSFLWTGSLRHGFPELWRLLTPLFVDGVGMGWIINMLNRYQALSSLELQEFVYNPQDLTYFFVLFLAFCHGVNYLMPDFLTFSSVMTLAIVYVWSQRNRDVMVRFLFGIQFKALYFPWALWGLEVLMDGAPLFAFMGILFGHIYYVLKFIAPANPKIAHFSQLVQAPALLTSLLRPRSTASRPGTGFVASFRQTFSGHRLGSGSSSTQKQ